MVNVDTHGKAARLRKDYWVFHSVKQSVQYIIQQMWNLQCQLEMEAGDITDWHSCN